MRKSELERMMARARELSDDADPSIELLSTLVILCGEQLLQMGEVRKAMSNFMPKLDSVAQAIVELEGKISGKLALTRYDFEDKT